MGEFGEQWFSALCVAARCDPSKTVVDVGGHDFVVCDSNHEVIRVQVKTTESPSWTATGLSFDLDVATYNKLRTGSTPGYLVTIVLHCTLAAVTRHFGRGTVVRATGYWLSLAGRAETTNTSTITLSLPRANMLTSEQLIGLFPARGGAP